MAKKSKRYTEAAALIENGRLYSAEEAIELVKKTSNVKFDASVDQVLTQDTLINKLEVQQYYLTELVKLKKFQLQLKEKKLKKLKMLVQISLLVKKFQKTSKKDGQISKL